MKFALIADYDATDPRVSEVRPVHREYLAKLRDAGKLVLSGPFTDSGGALIIYEADSKEEAAAIVDADPFTKAGVLKNRVIRPWNPVMVNRSLLPD
ncbi:MAG: YciI family protein [Acidobacteriota bacterium]